jgi:hypothetical protein
VAVPGAPTALVAFSVTSSSLSLSWSAPAVLGGSAITGTACFVGLLCDRNGVPAVLPVIEALPCMDYFCIALLPNARARPARCVRVAHSEFRLPLAGYRVWQQAGGAAMAFVQIVADTQVPTPLLTSGAFLCPESPSPNSHLPSARLASCSNCNLLLLLRARWPFCHSLSMLLDCTQSTATLYSATGLTFNTQYSFKVRL